MASCAPTCPTTKPGAALRAPVSGKTMPSATRDPFSLEGAPLARVRSLPYPLAALLLVALHLASTRFGYLMIGGGNQTTPVWPEAGMDIVELLLFGPR
jgi:hypothetical protein